MDLCPEKNCFRRPPKGNGPGVSDVEYPALVGNTEDHPPVDVRMRILWLRDRLADAAALRINCRHAPLPAGGKRASV